MKNKKTNKNILQWQTLDSIPYQRGLIWKINALIAVLLAVVLGYYFDALTFSLAILAFAFAYYVSLRHPPRPVNVSIREDGISLNKKLYPYSQIKRFWIIYEPPYLSVLHLHLRGKLFTEIKIHLADQSPATIRTILKSHIEELPNQQESFGEILTRLLKI